MQRYRQHVRIMLEKMRRAVALMNIQIDHRDPPHPPFARSA